MPQRTTWHGMLRLTLLLSADSIPRGLLQTVDEHHLVLMNSCGAYAIHELSSSVLSREWHVL